ncbi:unnamed protein product [Mortierella alpina]
MASILKRQKFKRGESKDSLLEKLKTSKLEDFEFRKSLPRGTYPNAMNIVIHEHGLPPSYRTDAFRVKTESVINPMEDWALAVDRFDTIWSSTHKRLEDSINAQRNKETDYKNVDKKEDDDDGKELRTCSVTMSHIIRPDMEPHAETILGLLTSTQEDVTNIILYLGTVVYKLYLLAAEGQFYQEASDATPIPLFYVKTLVPDRFSWDSKITSTIPMWPMPSDLQHRLEEASGKPNTEKGDLARFFSQDHLQHIFARLMGVRKGDTTEEADIDNDRETHPLWTRGLDLIKQHSERGDVPSAPVGLSNTVMEAIREFTTALSNMWSGPLYKKCLRYLCRIALRLWLAPSKDVKVKKWSANASKRKEERHQKRQERPETRKHWKAHTKQLFDDLGHVLLKRPPQWEEKVKAICKKLGEMEEPEH